MGTTFWGIHILSNEKIELPPYEFKSFSDGWQTCITDFSEIDSASKTARLFSNQICKPILSYYISDSDYIYFEFFQDGKCISRYCDGGFSNNKNLYGIPSVLGYGAEHKKRLSNILNCDDAEQKTALLEEYFGVCLLPFSEFFSDTLSLKREKSDTIYQEFIKNEQAISGNRSPVSLKLVKEYKGKIFFDYFHFGNKREDTIKKHCYLLGYDTPESSSESLTPVRFCGNDLEPISKEEFDRDRIPRRYHLDFYKIEYGAVCYASFNDKAPTAYANKKMKLPNNFYPWGFDTKNRLILSGNGKLYIVDDNFSIIAKVSLKGDCEDIVGDFILSATKSSFYAYAYDPKAKVRIYQLIDK